MTASAVDRFKSLLYTKQDIATHESITPAVGTSGPDEPVRPPAAPAVVKMTPGEHKARLKYTTELGQKILSVMQAGNTREVACASAGVDIRTFTIWARLANEGEEPFASFFDQVDRTEAGLEAVLVAIIRQKAQDDPNMAFRLLERRFPQRWAPGVQPAVNINMGQQNQMTPADARQVMRNLFGDLSPKKVIEAPTNEPEEP